MKLRLPTKKEELIHTSVRLPKRHFERIKNMAEKHGVSPADIHRALIKKALEK
jgi:predicted DNA-binding protein|tara:strand:+ start:4423 stop:4581 length:159 start_codon:yes stop_codon:yes gene_type:complete